MGFQTEINWVLVIKGTLWQGIQEFLVKHPDKEGQPFKVTKEGPRVYPVGHKIFLCDQSADNAVAVVKILEANTRYLSDEKTYLTDVTFTVDRQLRRSQVHNVREVLRYLS